MGILRPILANMFNAAGGGGSGSPIDVPAWDPFDLGAELEPGHTAFDLYVVPRAQSTGAGSTGLYSGETAPAYVIQNAAVSDRLRCPVGGIYSLRGNPSTPSLQLSVHPDDIASTVPAHSAINSFSQRDLPLMACGATLIRGLSAPHRIIIFQFCLGSTSVGQQIGGFPGSRFDGVADFDGTTMTVTALTDTAGAESDTLLTIPGIAVVAPELPGGQLTIVSQDVIEGDVPGLLGEYTMSDDVPVPLTGIAFTTSDPPPVQRQNYLDTMEELAAQSRAIGHTPFFVLALELGLEAEAEAPLPANVLASTLPTIDDFFNDLADVCHDTGGGAGINFGKKPVKIFGQVQYGQWLLNQVPLTNIPEDKTTPEGRAAVIPLDESLMGTLTPAQKATVDWTLRINPATGLRWSEEWAAFTRYFAEVDPDRNGPHYAYAGLGYPYIDHGEAAALMFIRIANDGGAVTRQHSAPYIVSATAVRNDAVPEDGETVDVVMSKALTVTTGGPVSDPVEDGITGPLGLDHYTDTLTRASPLAVAMADNTTIRLTLDGPGPGGLNEYVSIAGNSKQLVDWTYRYTEGEWPVNPPAGAVGNVIGPRTPIATQATLGTLPTSRRNLREYPLHDKVRILRRAAGSTFLDFLASIGKSAAFLFDFSDPDCFASGQVVTDLSAAAATFNRGLDDTVEASLDPAYTARAGAVPGFMGYTGTQSITPIGTPAFCADYHKGAQSITALAVYRLNDTTPAAFQPIAANCRNDAGGGAGFIFRCTTTSGAPGMTFRNASNDSQFNDNFDTPLDGWNVALWRGDAATDLSHWMTTRSCRYLMQITEGDPFTFPSPEAGAAEAALQIGRSYNSDDGAARHFDGDIAAVLFINEALNDEDMVALFLAASRYADDLPVERTGI